MLLLLDQFSIQLSTFRNKKKSQTQTNTSKYRVEKGRVGEEWVVDEERANFWQRKMKQKVWFHVQSRVFNRSAKRPKRKPNRLGKERIGQDRTVSNAGQSGLAASTAFCTCNAAPGREVRFGWLLVVGPNHRPKNRARSAQLGHRKIMQRRPVEQVAKQGAGRRPLIPRCPNRIHPGNQLVRGRFSLLHQRIAVDSPMGFREI